MDQHERLEPDGRDVLCSKLDTYHHGSGTAPMGGNADASAVVDGGGTVRRVQGLKVVDASTFPEIPSTPTNLTVIMLAERMAKAIIATS
ncbi:GMC oxidoreductase [Bradyrhizobium sp. USDA 3364]